MSENPIYVECFGGGQQQHEISTTSNILIYPTIISTVHDDRRSMLLIPFESDADFLTMFPALDSSKRTSKYQII